MADSIQAPLSLDAPIAAPSVSAPAASPSAPIPAAVSDAVPVSAPVEKVSETSTPTVEPVIEKTLLGADPESASIPDKTPDKAPEVKADTPPVEQKKEEGSQSDEPAQLPTYEAFTFPDGVTIEDARLGEFTKELGEFQNLTKADSAAMQEFGQKLVNRHVAEVQETVKRITEHYTNTWDKQKNDWKTALEKDPEIGGNRTQTAMKEIADTIASTSDPEIHKAFREYVSSSGIGNNPDVARPIYNLVKEVNRLRAKYESEDGVKPLTAVKPEPQATSKIKARYQSK